ncbi:MAG: hypothetical protein L0207_06745 [Chlamydiae bacterium]|nr:hypothetical protein [Chlamydiota bacterium]
MNQEKENRLSLTKAIGWILFSTIIINSSFYFAIQGYFKWKRKSSIEINEFVHAIIQTGPQKEALKTDYLAELMGISKDHPKKILEFDLKKAKKNLLSSPVIKEANLKFIRRGILYVDYAIRQPIALLKDYENIALDREGYFFPFLPFYSPKNIPYIYLDLGEKIQWHCCFKTEKIMLALDLLNYLTKPFVRDLFNVKLIDVSHATDENCGTREIILLVEDEFTIKREEREVQYIFPYYLRCSTKNYSQELNHYLKLKQQLLEKEKKMLPIPVGGGDIIRLPYKVIDFRIPQLAFIDDPS